MAAQNVLKELFEVSKQSILFKGMSESDIWKACLSHSENTDDEVRGAINNIKKKDREAEEKSLEKQKMIGKGKEKMHLLQEQELSDRKVDDQTAERILANLFN